MPIMNANTWSHIIKLLAFLLVLLGIIEIVLGVLAGFAWADFAVGVVTLTVGCMGLYAGFVKTINSAKRYFKSLILSTIAVCLILTVFVILVDQLSWKQLCEQQKWKPDDWDHCDSSNVRTYFLIIGVVQILFTLTCCLSCVCCARCYYASLYREQGHLIEVQGYGRASTFSHSPFLPPPPTIPGYTPTVRSPSVTPLESPAGSVPNYYDQHATRLSPTHSTNQSPAYARHDSSNGFASSIDRV